MAKKFEEVLNENLQAIKTAKAEGMSVKEVFETENIFDAVIETIEDLSEIFNSGYSDKAKWENRAKKFDEKLPALSAALRSEDLQKTSADMDKYCGWIKKATSSPKDNELVMVTNGIDVWMGYYNKGNWSVVYDGAPPFMSNDIIAWMFMPTVFADLFNE